MAARLALILVALWGCDSGAGGDPTGSDATKAPAAGLNIFGADAEVVGRDVRLRVEAQGYAALRVQLDDAPPLHLAGAGGGVIHLDALELGPHRLTIAAVTHADELFVAHEWEFLVAREVPLRPLAEAAPVELRLDREALAALLDPEQQAAIPVVDLDVRALVDDALATLLAPDPPGSAAWGVAERNLVDLLGTTPDTADAAGTPLAAVLALGERLGLPAGRLLSDLLGGPADAPILSRETLVETLLTQLIASHPAQEGLADPTRLRVTLADVLGDLAPLAVRYGPSGDHPGVLSGPPEAELFTSAFALVVRGEGRVARLPGVDARGHAATHRVLPADGPALAVDFEDPSMFRVEGLTPVPRAALRLRLTEDPRAFPMPAPGVGRPPEPEARPEWQALAPWTLEAIVLAAVRAEYADRAPATLSYAVGAIETAAVITWEADGWVEVSVAADLETVPAAYFYDLIFQVAQARLHDGLAEGEVDARLALPPLAIGLDAAQLEAAMRPTLAAHADALVEMMLGPAEALPDAAVLWREGDVIKLRADQPAWADAEMETPVTEVAIPGRLYTQDPDGAMVRVELETDRALWAPLTRGAP